ncbi:hypothetical protein E2C01_058381 [Portunus trituberculatus]|uniref:Uncharacterized protein n=1 Tax=Portunus trituberculatus TaxID=210409 RepID=A0A5B7H2U1_PORTR|nr:hypothetical protein [Portunus trituberculatus]
MRRAAALQPSTAHVRGENLTRAIDPRGRRKEGAAEEQGSRGATLVERDGRQTDQHRQTTLCLAAAGRCVLLT